MSSQAILIRLSMWDNDIQNYLPVGHVIYDNNSRQRLGFVGFKYDSSYVQGKYPAIDPAHLLPQRDNGCYIVKERDGRVPHYFASFLPGEFGQQLLSEVDGKWDKLTQAEKLYVMTHAHGDFGAPQLNPQLNQHNEPIGNLDDLSRLVKAIREFQRGERKSFITREIQGALCSFHGRKPKVDYLEESNGIRHRFVAKLNTSGCYNDARVAAAFTTLEKNAAISACDSRVVPLQCGEEVLFSYNYSRKEELEDNHSDLNGRTILKYNRISFKVLLADDPNLDNTKRASYKHLCYAINKYSADPISDREELYRRAVLSAATNHTSNGLDNLEMYDTGGGKWRLSPSFQNLPNPYTDAEFEVGFSDGLMTGNMLRFDESFLKNLGEQMGFSEINSLALAFPVINSLSDIDKVMDMHQVSGVDQQTISECVKTTQINALHSSLSQNSQVQQEINKSQNSFDVEFVESDVDLTASRSPGM